MKNTVHILSSAERKWQSAPLLRRSVLPATDSIRLDPGVTAQTIDGFGGCFNELGWKALEVLSPERRQQVLAELFDAEHGCKFNLCRMPIGANDFATSWYSFNEVQDDFAMAHFSIARDHQAIIPFIRAALAIQPELELWGSPWCPPSWMKQSGVYACSSVNGNWGQEFGSKHDDLLQASYIKEEAQVLDAYALYFVKFVQAYRAEGISVAAVHPQNEVLASQIFPSCLWKKEVMVRFIAEHLKPAFDAAGLDTELWFGTMNGEDRAYAEYVINHESVRDIISGAGFQWGAKHFLHELTRKPGLKLMQTESECHNGSNSWQTTEATVALMAHYFSVGVSSYMYWNLVLDEWGLSNWGWRQNSLVTVNHASGEVTLNPELYLMKHYSHFVQPGAKYVPSQAHPKQLQVACFRNPAGNLAIVIGNTGDSTLSTSLSVADASLALEQPAHSVSSYVFE